MLKCFMDKNSEAQSDIQLLLFHRIFGTQRQDFMRLLGKRTLAWYCLGNHTKARQLFGSSARTI